MGVSKKEISCPIDVTLSVIDGRWKGTILWRLLDEPMRMNELRKNIPEITQPITTNGTFRVRSRPNAEKRVFHYECWRTSATALNE